MGTLWFHSYSQKEKGKKIEFTFGTINNISVQKGIGFQWKSM